MGHSYTQTRPRAVALRILAFLLEVGAFGLRVNVSQRHSNRTECSCRVLVADVAITTFRADEIARRSYISRKQAEVGKKVERGKGLFMGFLVS